MEEYKKIDWRIRDLEYHEKVHDSQFIPDDCMSSLYLHRGFVDKQEIVKQTATLTLPEPSAPFVPGRKLFVGVKHRSLLTKLQHFKCLGALKCLRSGKDPEKFTETEKANIEIYKKLQGKIAEENAKYLAEAKKMWDQQCKGLTRLKPSVYKHIKLRWRKQLLRFSDYKPYYKDLKMVSLSYTDNDAPIEMVMTQNLLEVGTVAKCALPTLTCSFTLKLSTFPAENTSVYSKLAVSQDKNIEQLILQHPVDVVISSSGLQRLMDNTDLSARWDIPVVIKEVEVQQGTDKIKKKVVFIDKPLRSPYPTKADFSRTYHKLLLKSNLCEFEAFKYPNPDIVIENADDTKEVEEGTEKEKGKKLHHNVSYRLWRLSNKVQSHDVLMKTNNEVKTLTLLVRTKLDGCVSCENGVLQPVSVSPKIEYQLHFGGSIATKSELAREWTSLFFRPFSKLYRVRIDAPTYQVVMNESCSMQKVNTEAIVHHQYKPHLSLGVLHRVCVELTTLEPGNYILLHSPKHGTFAGILKEINESTADCYNLLKRYERFSPTLDNVGAWVPTDVNLILPMHEAYGRMPGLFQAKVAKCVNRVTKIKKSKQNLQLKKIIKMVTKAEKKI